MRLFLVFDLDLTFQGQSRSKVMIPNESSYMSLYKSYIVTLCLYDSRTPIGVIILE